MQMFLAVFAGVFTALVVFTLLLRLFIRWETRRIRRQVSDAFGQFHERFAPGRRCKETLDAESRPSPEAEDGEAS